MRTTFAISGTLFILGICIIDSCKNDFLFFLVLAITTLVGIVACYTGNKILERRD